MNGTTIERTTIRSTPGGDVVRTLPAGAKVEFTLGIGSWHKVISAEGVARSGYINARSVKVDVYTPPPPVPTPKTVTNIITVYDDGSILVAPQ